MKTLSLLIVLALGLVAVRGQYLENRNTIIIQPQPQWDPYYSPYWSPYPPYQPDNGPMRGPNSIQGHQHRAYER